MTSREERERRRAERLAAEKAEHAAARRRLMIGYVVAGGLALAVVVGLVIVIASSGGSDQQVNGEDVPASAHIQVQSGFVHDVKPDPASSQWRSDGLIISNKRRGGAHAECYRSHHHVFNYGDSHGYRLFLYSCSDRGCGTAESDIRDCC